MAPFIIKIVAIITAIIVAILGILFLLNSLFGRNTVDPNEAHKDKKNRYITIYNDTEKIINDITIKASDGRKIINEKNPDDDPISFRISHDYDDYNTFDIK